MKLSVPCAQGQLQITDNGYLQLTNTFGTTKWSIPAKSVGDIASIRKLMTFTVTISTPSVQHTVTTMTRENVEKLRTAIAEYQQ